MWYMLESFQVENFKLSLMSVCAVSLQYVAILFILPQVKSQPLALDQDLNNSYTSSALHLILIW